MRTYRIAVIAGSLRKESFSRKIAKYIAGLMPENFEIDLIDLSGLDMYNQDLDDEHRPPQSWVDFRNVIGKADGFLFVTPEYNRSFPAVLKNALDIASRPMRENKWGGKPGAIVGVTPGNMFAITGATHLRQPMASLNIQLMLKPEQFIANAAALLDENGGVKDAHKQQSLKEYAEAFAKWVEKVLA
ncbi:ACP phosphodiesterase [Clostridia bacterium]|nr:ACP phosphodiesterase [Clostridia bacterium]